METDNDPLNIRRLRSYQTLWACNDNVAPVRKKTFCVAIMQTNDCDLIAGYATPLSGFFRILTRLWRK